MHDYYFLSSLTVYVLNKAYKHTLTQELFMGANKNQDVAVMLEDLGGDYNDVPETKEEVKPEPVTVKQSFIAKLWCNIFKRS